MTSDLQINNPQVNVDIDRDKAIGPRRHRAADRRRPLQRLRLPPGLHHLYAQQPVPGDLELEPQYQTDPSALSMLYIRSANGQLVPLDTVATSHSGRGPLTVNHLGQFPSVTISFNLKPGVPLGEAVPQWKKWPAIPCPQLSAPASRARPRPFSLRCKGCGFLLLMAILVIYIVLGILYESFIHPLTILSGLPSAGFGALLTLLIFQMELNIYAFVGIIMLIGIVKKNAIMMIDFALEASASEGKSPQEAIYQGCSDPFPAHHDDHHGGPHGHTAHCPRALAPARIPPAAGAGGGRRPALFPAPTLYITPVIYIYMESLQGNIKALFGLQGSIGHHPVVWWLSSSIRKHSNVCNPMKCFLMLTQLFEKLRVVSMSNHTKS